MTTTTHEIPTATTIELATSVLGLQRETGRVVLVEQEPRRPPKRINGWTIGAGYVQGESPHGGEMHPDGDEILYLVSGCMDVRLELDDGEHHVELEAGEALVVPQGVWHLITVKEPGHLVNITPGPNGDARPRRGAS